MKEIRLRLLKQLAEAGVERPWQLMDCTPAELILFLQGHQACERRRLDEIWLLSKYTALAVHAPDQLPPRPPAPLHPMTDDEMKRRLLGWRRKDD